MKQIFENKYLKVFKFASSGECLTFYNNQITERRLFIEDGIGNNYYCYVCYHSLTREKQFALCFGSDRAEEDLNILFWDNKVVLDTGSSVYLINEGFNINTSLELTTPLIGLYLINNERLLLLEEAYLQMIDFNGQILNSEVFDLIEDFSIGDNVLYIRTIHEKKVIELA